ncbi:MAG TPA: glycosyltransferase family 4 protein [Alphaproteobacteria bacterium]|jgi:UDP-N-acetylmuramyl pentapeptide phosphotransferase/UDP-N-acetylglucosamine-1-phosphate transferase
MSHWVPAILAFILPLAATAVGVRLLLPWLAAGAMLDRPNERSSHQNPTPRGGGLVVVAVVALALWTIQIAMGAPLWRLAVLTAALVGLAAVSWLDDRRGADWRLRLALQLVAVVAGLFAIGIGPLAARLGLASWLVGIPLALAWMWFVNLYNFMDGIDGITGTETASIGVGLVALAVVSLGSVAGQGLAGLALAGAAIGFLIWNWHPARIFLGDVGSVPLGYIVGGFLIEAVVAGQWAAALILPLYYLADATIVLVARALSGRKPWEAHKSHFYQRAHQGGLSHGQVSLCIGALNIVLIALAAAAGLGWSWLALLAAAAAVALLLAYFAARGAAGARPEAAKNPTG